MKLVVLVPTAEYKVYAGARIRYGRVALPLAEHGIELTLQEVSEFKPQSDDCDILLISKCHDARSLLAAAIVSQRGRLVGVDLFDDYFSQAGDSRLTKYRNWLTQLLPICDFALCSTEVMKGVVRSYHEGIPTHVMNDPGPPLDTERLAETLRRKMSGLRDRRCVRVGWFGVGDNPNFRVGLDDLEAFGGRLRELARGEMSVEFSILTNARALSADGLSRLKRIPVETSVEEWTEERERSLLAACHVAFLPVGAHSFSIAKSLNRAVTALASGCQVLSLGYPLYAPFEELLYRDVQLLASDLEAGNPKLNPGSVQSCASALESFASAAVEAARLTAFLGSVRAKRHPPAPLVVVHGHSTNGLAHKLAHAAGGLSVASPSCTASFRFDVIFRQAPGQLAMFVSDRAVQRLRPSAARKLQPAGSFKDMAFSELTNARTRPSGISLGAAHAAALSNDLATYSADLSEIRSRIDECFGPSRVFLSETSPLPFALAQ